MNHSYERTERGRFQCIIKFLIIFLTGFFIFNMMSYACDYDECDGLPIEKTECPYCIYENWDDDLKEYTHEMCVKNDVEEEYVLAIIYNESRFQADAIGTNSNGTKDWGLMQINDSTYDFLHENAMVNDMSDLLDERMNIYSGIQILKYHQEYTNSNDDMLLRYQVGEGSYESLKSSGIDSTDTSEKVSELADVFSEIVKI